MQQFYVIGNAQLCQCDISSTIIAWNLVCAKYVMRFINCQMERKGGKRRDWNNELRRKAIRVLDEPEQELDEVDHFCALIGHDLRQITNPLSRRVLMNSVQQMTTEHLLRQHNSQQVTNTQTPNAQLQATPSTSQCPSVSQDTNQTRTVASVASGVDSYWQYFGP